MAGRVPVFLAGLVWFGAVQGRCGGVTGQWDFEQGDLRATVGTSLRPVNPDHGRQFEFGSTKDFGLPAIGDATPRVLHLPATSGPSGLIVAHGAQPIPPQLRINQYTLIVDLLLPEKSWTVRRPLFEPQFREDGRGFRFHMDGTNGIGSIGDRSGALRSNTWHRIVIRSDQMTKTPAVDKFIDGRKVGTEIGRPTDAEWSLEAEFRLFADDVSGCEEVYINSIQFRDMLLSDEYIQALGAASPEGVTRGPPPRPFLASMAPHPESALFPARSVVSPFPTLRAVLEDGVARVRSDSVRVYLDNVELPRPALNVISSVGSTSITYEQTVQLAPQSRHSVRIEYADDAPVVGHYTNEWAFVVEDYRRLDAASAVAADAAGPAGFRVRTVQAIEDLALPNSLDRAIRQINGTLLDVEGSPVVDVAVPGPLPDGAYVEPGTINYEAAGEPFGNFKGDQRFPGLSGSNDNFTTDIWTWLRLSAGLHRLGVSVTIVQVDRVDDDGFALFTGWPQGDFFAEKLMQFRNTVGGFLVTHLNSEVTVQAPVDGLYPFRLLFWQTRQPASLEFYSVDSASGRRVLINDTTEELALRAFSSVADAREVPPHVVELRPRPGTAGNPATESMHIWVADPAQRLGMNSFELLVNGQLRTGTAKLQGDVWHLQWEPNEADAGRTNVVTLLLRDPSTQLEVREQQWWFVRAHQGGGGYRVAGQWDFEQGDLSATVGKDLNYLDGPTGDTAVRTRFGTTESFGLPAIDGVVARVMYVPGDVGPGANRQGYVMQHGLLANGGGQRVNQFVIVMDLLWPDIESGWGWAAMINYDPANTGDGDMFIRVSDGGWGQGEGYNGDTVMSLHEWHRVVWQVDMAHDPPWVRKFLDGRKHADWLTGFVDDDRRTMDVRGAVLFGDGDEDERRPVFVNSVQVIEGVLTEKQLRSFGRPTGAGIPFEPRDVYLIEAIQLTDSGVKLRWYPEPNLVLESAPALATEVWSEVSVPVGEGEVVLPLDGTSRFYRLVKRP